MRARCRYRRVADKGNEFLGTLRERLCRPKLLVGQSMSTMPGRPARFRPEAVSSSYRRPMSTRASLFGSMPILSSPASKTCRASGFSESGPASRCRSRVPEPNPCRAGATPSFRTRRALVAIAVAFHPSLDCIAILRTRDSQCDETESCASMSLLSFAGPEDQSRVRRDRGCARRAPCWA